MTSHYGTDTTLCGHCQLVPRPARYVYCRDCRNTANRKAYKIRKMLKLNKEIRTYWPLISAGLKKVILRGLEPSRS